MKIFYEDSNFDTSMWAYRTYDGRLVMTKHYRRVQENTIARLCLDLYLKDYPLATPFGLEYLNWIWKNDFTPTKFIQE